jgi:hypothetical protein
MADARVVHRGSRAPFVALTSKSPAPNLRHNHATRLCCDCEIMRGKSGQIRRETDGGRIEIFVVGLFAGSFLRRRRSCGRRQSRASRRCGSRATACAGNRRQGQQRVLSYAIVAQDVEFAGARNCGK